MEWKRRRIEGIRQNSPLKAVSTHFYPREIKNSHHHLQLDLRPQGQILIMPPSQLKQLKASLRNNGVLGPQQSKKQKRRDAKTGASAHNRIQRNVALQAIREQFNPFEVKAPVKRVKFDVTTRDGGSQKAGGQVRPGVTKSLGEEKVRL